MKQKLKNIIQQVAKDRLFLALLVVFTVFGLVFVGFAFAQVQRSELLVWYRYTGFGATRYYRAKWFYFYTWPILGLSVVLGHGWLALLSMSKKQRLLAFGFLVSGALVLMIAFFNLGHIVALPR